MKRRVLESIHDRGHGREAGRGRFAVVTVIELPVKAREGLIGIDTWAGNDILRAVLVQDLGHFRLASCRGDEHHNVAVADRRVVILHFVLGQPKLGEPCLIAGLVVTGDFARIDVDVAEMLDGGLGVFPTMKNTDDEVVIDGGHESCAWGNVDFGR